MSNPARSRRALGLTLLVAVASGLAIATFVSGAGIGAGAEVAEEAERIPTPVGDLVVMFDVREVDAAVVDAARRVAAASGGGSTVARTGSLGMTSITRGDQTVHAAPAGWLIPMVYLSAPAAPIGRITSPDVAAALDPDTAVMNEVTAELTGARVGDVVHMRAANGSPVSFPISAIFGPDEIGAAELVFTYDVAARLGATEDTRVVIHDFDRAALDAAIAREGLDDRPDTRVARSWDPPRPDSTLDTMDTKVLLGEPIYRFNGDGSISMHPDWVATNLPDDRELLNDQIRIRARCHRAVVGDLRAALAEMAAAGLGGAIDVGNTNTYGGCYGGARFSRVSGQIGFLSRHSYGQAIDMNTVSNCLGCVPKMSCDVVRIFRKHGFAWGGNFRTPDGMHFEWVGEPRDQVVADVEYCPNVVNALTQSVGAVELGADVLTLDGEDGAHDHDHDHD